MNMSTNRDYEDESKDNLWRKYHYGFDTYIRKKMIERWSDSFDGQTALEIGSYKGDMTRLLLPHFSDLTVVEASEHLSKEISEAIPAIKVVNSEVEKWVTKERYRNIFLVHTLEHMEDPQRSLTSIAKLLDDSGRLYVAVPNAKALSRQIAVEMGILENVYAVSEGERLQGHFRTYDLAKLVAELEMSGLKVEKSGGIVFKTLANFQIDEGLEQDLISLDYLEACNNLSRAYPDFSASVYVVAKKTGMNK